MIIYTAWSVVFKKSLIVKTFPVCLSISRLHPFFILSYRALSIEVELWGERRIPPNFCLAVLCSSTVCVYEMQIQPCVACLVERQGKILKNGYREW